MHRPPAVSYTVRRSSGHLALVVLLCVAGVAAITLLAQSAAAPLSLWSAFILCLLATLFAIAGWWRSDTGALRWDGQAWLWSGFGDVAVHHSVLVLDFQKLILLKLYSANGAVAWLWLQGGGSADRTWLALRRAIVAADQRTPPQSHDSLATEGDRL